VALASPETAFQGDIIAFEAAGWIDDDHPLTYVFSAMLPSGQEIIFSDASEVPRVELAVAIAGDPAKSNKLQIRARVFDSVRCYLKTWYCRKPCSPQKSSSERRAPTQQH
jgi:hypothetical protein